MNGGGSEARGGFPQVKREFYINQHGQRGKKWPVNFRHKVVSSLLPRSEGGRKWCRQAMENLDCLLQLGPGNLEEQDWQVPQGTIRPNLKGIFVESGISLA